MRVAAATRTSARAGPTTPVGRALVLFTVTLATTLYGTTILTVSVILPQMQGSLSATQDQIAWSVTFNILATAIVTPMTGWLTARFGRRGVMLTGLVIFTFATLMCGLSDSLGALVFWRIVQGGAGAPLVPLAQATILDTYPKQQHAMATSVFGMGVVIGPVIGPILGGQLADMYDWRWAFFMIVPVGVAAFAGLWFVLTDAGRQHRPRFDWTGFLALSVALACLQLMLDRGQRRDWFESPEIIAEALAAAIAFWVFLVHSMTTERPFLNLRHLLDRNYALGLVCVFVYGMLNFTPMVLFPQLLQAHLGYPNTVIGELLGARGAGAMLGFFLAMPLGRLDPRIGMLIGVAIQVSSGLLMMTFDLNLTFWDVATASFLQGIAVGLFWVPLTVATFSTINPAYLAETSATYHLLRNLGSSIFISLSVTAVIRTAAANYARLGEHVSPFNDALTALPAIVPWSLEDPGGLASLAGVVARQAAMIGYLHAFELYAAASLAMLPLVLLFRIRRRPDR